MFDVSHSLAPKKFFPSLHPVLSYCVLRVMEGRTKCSAGLVSSFLSAFHDRSIMIRLIRVFTFSAREEEGKREEREKETSSLSFTHSLTHSLTHTGWYRIVPFSLADSINFCRDVVMEGRQTFPCSEKEGVEKSFYLGH